LARIEWSEKAVRDDVQRSYVLGLNSFDFWNALEEVKYLFLDLEVD